MNIVDLGSGAPIVVIPGIQGRWEWMRAGIEALAQQCRVITFSLCDEPTCGGEFDENAGLDSYVEQVRMALDTSGLTGAVICGVSYGGSIAVAFAARYPERVASLILVSALPPAWQPDARLTAYLRFPWVMAPLFCLGSVRLYSEIAAAADSRRAALRSAAAHAVLVLRHMFHPARMARRARLLSSPRIGRELGSVQLPVLLVTGEDALDTVVPPRLTREYMTLWPHARTAVITRSGHLGLTTRSAEFAAIVSSFAVEHERFPGSQTLSRRRIG